MRRNGLLTLFGVLTVFCLGMYVYAEGEFTLDCVECGSSDSGTATGDGTGGVGTSDGTADFGGPVPTFASIGLKHPKDLRFILTINNPTPTTEPCTLSSQEIADGFTSCTFTYPAVNVDQLKFFVSTDSTYCLQSPSPCQTILSVRLGEHFEGDEKSIVIFSAPLVADGVQLDLAEETVLQMSNKQVKELSDAIKAVTDYDPANPQFILGFAVQASAVDPILTDTIKVKLMPLKQILSIATIPKK